MTCRLDRRDRATRGLVATAPAPALALILLAAVTTFAGDVPAPPCDPAAPAAEGSASPDALSLLFPLEGQTTFSDTFGDPRSGGRAHRATDLMADKGTRVLAVADGAIDWIQDGSRGRCCAVGLRHADGSRSLYMHLDNDTPGTDDGLRVGIAPGLRVGSAIRRGMLLGWVGDSGNAESTAPHLHFELLAAAGEHLNPFGVLAKLRPDAVQRQAVAPARTAGHLRRATKGRAAFLAHGAAGKPAPLPSRSRKHARRSRAR